MGSIIKRELGNGFMPVVWGIALHLTLVYGIPAYMISAFVFSGAMILAIYLLWDSEIKKIESIQDALKFFSDEGLKRLYAFLVFFLFLFWVAFIPALLIHNDIKKKKESHGK